MAEPTVPCKMCRAGIEDVPSPRLLISYQLLPELSVSLGAYLEKDSRICFMCAALLRDNITAALDKLSLALRKTSRYVGDAASAYSKDHWQKPLVQSPR